MLFGRCLMWPQKHRSRQPITTDTHFPNDVYYMDRRGPLSFSHANFRHVKKLPRKQFKFNSLNCWLFFDACCSHIFCLGRNTEKKDQRFHLLFLYWSCCSFVVDFVPWSFIILSLSFAKDYWIFICCCSWCHFDNF